MLSISITERRMFRNCRRKWWYQKVLGIIPSRERERALWVGGGVHVGLETYYRGLLKRKKAGDPVASFKRWFTKQPIPTDLTELEHEELEADRDLSLGMLAGYGDWARAQDNFNVLHVEHQVARPIPGLEAVAQVTGKVDLVLRDRRGRIGFLDHKTTAVEPDLSWLDLDDQMTGYAWLLQGQKEFEELGITMAWHNFLRKKLPAVPHLLNRGGLTQNKALDTTYEIYLAELKRHKLRRSDYDEMLDALKQRGNRFYYRIPIQRSPAEIEQFVTFLRSEFADMARTAACPQERAYPNPDFFCSRCVYRTLCKTELEHKDSWLRALETGQFDVEDTQYQRGITVASELSSSGVTVQDILEPVLEALGERTAA